jgi:hypothetical protein
VLDAASEALCIEDLDAHFPSQAEEVHRGRPGARIRSPMAAATVAART